MWILRGWRFFDALGDGLRDAFFGSSFFFFFSEAWLRWVQRAYVIFSVHHFVVCIFIPFPFLSV